MIVSQWTHKYSFEKPTNRVAMVFADDKRPIMEGKILEDLQWRRTHDTPIKPSLVLAAIKPYLPEGQYTIGYSRYAGCSACPCSPGYIIKRKRVVGEYSFRTREVDAYNVVVES